MYNVHVVYSFIAFIEFENKLMNFYNIARSALLHNVSYVVNYKTDVLFMSQFEINFKRLDQQTSNLLKKSL